MAHAQDVKVMVSYPLLTAQVRWTLPEEAKQTIVKRHGVKTWPWVIWWLSGTQIKATGWSPVKCLLVNITPSKYSYLMYLCIIHQLAITSL
jgi:hypothetical protein